MTSRGGVDGVDGVEADLVGVGRTLAVALALRLVCGAEGDDGTEGVGGAEDEDRGGFEGLCGLGGFCELRGGVADSDPDGARSDDEVGDDAAGGAGARVSTGSSGSYDDEAGRSDASPLGATVGRADGLTLTGFDRVGCTGGSATGAS